MVKIEAIRDLFLDAAQQPALFSAPSTNLYSLAKYGLLHHLFRVKTAYDGKRKIPLEERLATTSTLTPVDLCDIDYGQLRLLLGRLEDGLQVVSYIPEQTLYDGFGKVDVIHYLKTLSSLSVANYAGMQLALDYLTQHDLASDLRPMNITDTLKLLDINDHVRGNLDAAKRGWLIAATHNFERVETELLHAARQELSLTKEVEKMVEAIAKKLRTAQEFTHFPENRDEVEKLIKKRGPVPSGLRVVDTKLGNALSLEAAPAQLRAMIEALDQERPLRSQESLLAEFDPEYNIKLTELLKKYPAARDSEPPPLFSPDKQGKGSRKLYM